MVIVDSGDDTLVMTIARVDGEKGISFLSGLVGLKTWGWR